VFIYDIVGRAISTPSLSIQRTVPIPSDPGSVSTRVFQMLGKALPNPTNHISCIPTFAIQMLGKAVPNLINHGPCVASNLIIQTQPKQNSDLASTHVILGLS